MADRREAYTRRRHDRHGRHRHHRNHSGRDEALRDRPRRPGKRKRVKGHPVPSLWDLDVHRGQHPACGGHGGRRDSYGSQRRLHLQVLGMGSGQRSGQEEHDGDRCVRGRVDLLLLRPADVQDRIGYRSRSRGLRGRAGHRNHSWIRFLQRNGLRSHRHRGDCSRLLSDSDLDRDRPLRQIHRILLARLSSSGVDLR